jgi:hypothetical protein
MTPRGRTMAASFFREESVMPDEPKPSYAEFLKSLLIVLLFESAACTASNACRFAFAAHATLGPIAATIALIVIAGAGLSNLASMCATHFVSLEEKFKPFAQTSFCLTASQTVLIGAICFSRGATVNAAVAAVSLAALLLVYRFIPGNFPPNFEEW